MIVESPAFEHHATIPGKYTCEGEDVSPQLKISEVPSGTQSLAIIVDDPDAPVGTFVHWVAWNIAPDQNEIAEGASIPIEGTNDFRVDYYRGPCPPPGSPHRYFFKVYALDTMLEISRGSSKADLLSAMEGHILGQAELVGIYER